MNYGGLHNRLTKKIHLHPFTLRECELFCQSRNLGYKRNMIVEAYMALGGIPYYWNFMQKGLSVAQNFDRMFFSEDGEMAQEYDALYAFLFRKPHVHISIIKTLSVKKAGMTRSELLEMSDYGVTSGSDTHSIQSMLEMDDLFS